MLTLPDSGRLRARLHSVHARGRVADALLGVALDVVQPFASDYLSADEFNHLSEVVQAPVDAATQAALTTIESKLALVVEADADIKRRIPRSDYWSP